MKKRILAAILALLLIAVQTGCSEMTESSNASENAGESTSAPAESSGIEDEPQERKLTEPASEDCYRHIHSAEHVCDAGCADARWEAWTETDSLPFTGKHHIYLTGNVDLKTAWALRGDADITVCLNGYNINCVSYIELSGPGVKLTITDCCAAEADGVYSAGMIRAGGKTGFRAFYISDTSEGAELNLYDGIITGFSSEKTGGVINYGANAVFNMYGGILADNEAVGVRGGAVYVRSTATFNMYGGTICGNKGTDGGGICGLYGSHINILGGAVWGNYASGNGGGIYAEGSMDIADCSICRNEAAGCGGGIADTEWYAAGEWLSVKNCVISENKAGQDGGGIWNGTGNQNRIRLEQLTVRKNEAAGNGGGLCLIGTAAMKALTVEENRAVYGGGIYIDSSINDGHALISGRYTLEGNMFIRNNTDTDLYLPERAAVSTAGNGLGEKTEIGVTLTSGVLTDAFQGRYDYSLEDGRYLVTYGSRSVTEPEYDTSAKTEWKDP